MKSGLPLSFCLLPYGNESKALWTLPDFKENSPAFHQQHHWCGPALPWAVHSFPDYTGPPLPGSQLHPEASWLSLAGSRSCPQLLAPCLTLTPSWGWTLSRLPITFHFFIQRAVPEHRLWNTHCHRHQSERGRQRPSLPEADIPVCESSNTQGTNRWNLILVDMWACLQSSFSHVRLFVTLRTVDCQSPLSMGFSR